MSSTASSMAMSRIVLTAGEPAGIGPDLCVHLAQQAHNADITIIADPLLLEQRASMLELPLTIDVVHESTTAEIPAKAHSPGTIRVMPVELAAPVIPGKLDARNAASVIRSLELATDNTLSGEFDALVTGPVHKGIINDAGLAFTGHTEFLAERTHADLPVMMLQTPGLRVALATTHMPLAQVSAAITATRLKQVAEILCHDLEHQFGIENPCIYVCGLNPHAGENGHLGTEEINVIEPVLSQLRKKGLDLVGPLSADTIFSEQNRQKADAFLAMYHDQGLPVLKTLGFGKSINVTLGLPIVRTSVDHGTALELAGTGSADCGSLTLAIQTAIETSCHRQLLSA